MNCIICNNPSVESISVEHIVPESLGNTKYILERGVVCDGCNNYFARKVEGPLLEMPFFKQLRHRLDIENKKGRIPSDKGFIIKPDIAEVVFIKDKRKGNRISVQDENVRKKLSRRCQLPVFVPEFGLFDATNEILSKFLAKVAIEGLAYDVIQAKESIEVIVNQSGFNSIKQYCRYAKKNQFWPYSIRQINLSDQITDEKTYAFLKNLIFYYAFIFVSPGYFFHQLYVSGVELTIDMVNPTLQSIHEWQKENPVNCQVLENALAKFQQQ